MARIEEGRPHLAVPRHEADGYRYADGSWMERGHVGWMPPDASRLYAVAGWAADGEVLLRPMAGGPPVRATVESIARWRP